MRNLKAIILFLTLFILLFFQVYELVREISLLKITEKRLKEISLKLEDLEFEFSEKSSISWFEDYLKNSNLTKIQTPKFLEVLESGVVGR